MITDSTQRYHLPNNLSVFHKNSYETVYVYQEIFVDDIYLQNGITIHDDAIVFDIGANIGLFSLYLKQKYPSVKVYAFEPSQEIYQLLQLNIADHTNDIKAFNLGISDKDGIDHFYYYPQFSVISGFNVDSHRDAEIILNGAKNGDQQIDPQLIATIKQRLSDIITTPCQMKTISSIIQQQQIEQIDLIKMDAEGSELAILNGINQNDWTKIRQIVMEVHNQNDLQIIPNILMSNGYQVTVELDKRLKGANIYNLYAVREV